MSVLYSIYATVNIPFAGKSIKFIVQKASELGFKYMASGEDKKTFGIDSCFLDVDQATSKLLTITEKILYSGGPVLYGKFQDTEFLFRVYETEDKLTGIGIADFCPRWDKGFCLDNSVYDTIDFARYLRLMLQICKELSLIELRTFTDDMDALTYADKNYATAAVGLGLFKEIEPNDIQNVKESIQRVIRNGIQNRFIFFDETMEKQTEPSVEQCYETFKAEFPVCIYAKVDIIAFRIEIKHNAEGYDFLSVYPLEPYQMKKGYESDESKIDLAFYVERLVELCDNIIIYELRTFM